MYNRGEPAVEISHRGTIPGSVVKGNAKVLQNVKTKK